MFLKPGGLSGNFRGACLIIRFVSKCIEISYVCLKVLNTTFCVRHSEELRPGTEHKDMQIDLTGQLFLTKQSSHNPGFWAELAAPKC